MYLFRVCCVIFLEVEVSEFRIRIQLPTSIDSFLWFFSWPDAVPRDQSRWFTLLFYQRKHWILGVTYPETSWTTGAIGFLCILFTIYSAKQKKLNRKLQKHARTLLGQNFFEWMSERDEWFVWWASEWVCNWMKDKKTSLPAVFQNQVTVILVGSGWSWVYFSWVVGW